MLRWLSILALVLILFGCAFLWLLRGATLPSDDTIVERFRRNLPHFEQLQKMLASDIGVRSVAKYGVTTDSSVVAKPFSEVGMSETKFNEYMSILRSLDAFSAIHDDEEYRFGIAAWGFASKGWRLAYVYRETPPDPAMVIDTIDGFKPGGKQWRKGYRPLGDHWYAWIIW